MRGLVLASTFTDNGQLGRSDGSLQSQFLILGVILGVFWLFVTCMFAYYLAQFRKNASPTKLYGRAFLGMGAVFSAVILVCWILILAFVLNAKAIFDSGGKYVLDFNNGPANNAFNATLALVIVGFVLAIGFALIVYMFLPRFGILFDEEKIMFIGEGIKYQQIINLVHDKNRNALFINYTQGKNTIRKQKFALSSIFGQFMLENVALTSKPVLEDDEAVVYKQLVEQIKSGGLTPAVPGESAGTGAPTPVDNVVNAETPVVTNDAVSSGAHDGEAPVSPAETADKE